jgi:signal transduction histidine kinase
MFGSISTKLLVAVIAAVALPFAGFAFYIEYRVADELMLELVQQSLRGLSKDLGEQVDAELIERREDLRLWSAEPVAYWALDERRRELEALEAGLPGGLQSWGPAHTLALAKGDEGGDILAGASLFRLAQTRSFDHYVAQKQHYTLILLLDAEGALVATNSRDHLGRPLPESTVEHLFARNWAQEPWFVSALERGEAELDQHRSPWLFPEGPPTREPLPSDFHVGLAHAVDRYLEPGERAGVLFTLVDWTAFQDLVSSRVIQDTFRGLVAAGEVPSPYAWIWSADGDRILGHRDPRLYGSSLTAMGLEQMVEDVRASSWGLYRPYQFRGVAKTAAFCHTLGPRAGGFGWIVGVGIDDRDIYAATGDLRDELFRGTVVLLLLSVLLVMVIARRTTGPILALEEHTRKVAAGDLEARLEIESRDEVGRLATAFNRMTGELAAQREQLVKAEKDAAWREMARQIAHDLKNPLTPIQLSLDLLERSRRDGTADRDQILERTTALMRRQVAELRQIATDFYEFTGGRRPEPAPVDLRALLEDVYALHRAWAEERRVELRLAGEAPPARVDPTKIRRVLVNLVSNALQAMPDGGVLEGEVRAAQGGVALELRDTGAGLSPEARAHLFEPYFTTKTEGTGLGLAIARRAVEEAGGRIALEPAPDDGRGGAVARLWLPAAAGGPEA